MKIGNKSFKKRVKSGQQQSEANKRKHTKQRGQLGFKLKLRFTHRREHRNTQKIRKPLQKHLKENYVYFH